MISSRAFKAGALAALSSLLLTFAVFGCKDHSGGGGGSGSGSTNNPTNDEPETGEIVIGGYLSMTGSTADFGINTKRGADLAVKEINAAGGIKGRRVRFVVLDDQGRADEAASAVTRLIDVEGAVAILGEVASTLSLQGGRICQRKGVPMVSPSSTNEQVTLIGNNVFRVCFIDPFQGYVMARFARENLHLDRVAILQDNRSDYSIGLARAFTENFTRLGGTIVGQESFQAGETDFSAQLTTLKAADPQGLYIPAYYSEVGNIARQSRRLGMTATLLGGDGWDSPQLREIGGADIVGAYYSNHFAPDNPSPRAREFIEAYRREYDATPTGLGALGYDAAAIIMDAMKRSNEITPAAIRAELEATRDFAGVTGVLNFNATRDSVKPAVVLRVTEQGDVFETQIEPQ
jgi:branched-chain amino acid transport system substrate-binding protein